jgi:hypothetical protein
MCFQRKAVELAMPTFHLRVSLHVQELAGSLGMTS